MLGNHIKLNSKVIEFGAGNNFLCDYLDNSIQYTPSDIFKRNEDTLVCDLNDPSTYLDLTNYDVAVFSGVFEYIYDIDEVFNYLKDEIPQINMSYCCSDIIKTDRLKSGWLSDYTLDELKTIFKKYDYSIKNYELWRNQSIFILHKIIN